MSDQPRFSYVLEYENDLTSFFNNPALPKAAKTLALFCSIPYYLTPELVYWLRDHLLPTDGAYDIETDVLRAPFVYLVRGRYHRMERGVRETLRAWLRSERGREKEYEVAEVLLKYVRTSKPPEEDDAFWQYYLESQQLAAQAVLNPREIAEYIARRLREWQNRVYDDEEANLLLVSRCAVLAEEATVDLQRLGGGVHLIQFARNCADWAQGRQVKVTQELSRGLTLFNVELLPLEPAAVFAPTQRNGDQPRLEISMLGTTRRAIGHTQRVNRLAWSANGEKLFSSSQDRTFRVWDFALYDPSGRPHDYEFTMTEDPSRQLEAANPAIVAWSPDGRYLADGDNGVRVWSIEEKPHLLWEAAPPIDSLTCLAWSPANQWIAAGSSDGAVCLLDSQTGRVEQVLSAGAAVGCLAFSPDGALLAVGTDASDILIWEMHSQRLESVLRGHTGAITCLAWSAEDTRTLFSGSEDTTIRIWDAYAERTLHLLKEHTRPIVSLTISHDGSMLASAAQDEMLCMWSRPRDYTLAYMLTRKEMNYAPGDIAFHPRYPLLAAASANGAVEATVYFFELLHGGTYQTPSHYYSSARVIVVGDSGVGKTSLCNALLHEDFKPVYSTHAVNIWRLDSREHSENGGRTRREVWLWDLAGEADYQLIHQLYLRNVSVALEVFSGSTERSSHSLRRWDQLLRQVEARDQARGKIAQPRMRKLVVQNRIDLPGTAPFHDEAFLKEIGGVAYFSTSAKTGEGIEELRHAILNSIEWSLNPRATTSIVMETIRDFLSDLPDEQKVQVISLERLYKLFLESGRLPNADRISDLRQQFENCLNLLEDSQVVRRFAFANLVLLQPALLISYAASIIAAARSDDRTQFGRLEERAILQRQIPLPTDLRIRDPLEEKWMLIATIQDLLDSEVAIRDSEGILIFPSHVIEGRDEQFTHAGWDEVIFSFSGAGIGLYAMLIVRLSRSGEFTLKQLARNKAQFIDAEGGLCGISLDYDGNETRIAVYFEESVSRLTRYTLDLFINTFLRRQLTRSSITRARVYRCANPHCPSEERVRFDPVYIRQRFQLGKQDIRCPVCDELTDLTEPPITNEMREILRGRVGRMNRLADVQRQRQMAESIYQAKHAVGQYDAYLMALPFDAAQAEQVAAGLRLHGIVALTEAREFSTVLKQVSTVVFLFGSTVLSEVEENEWHQAVQAALDAGVRVIFALYQVEQLPEWFLKAYDGRVRTVYLLTDAENPLPLTELSEAIAG